MGIFDILTLLTTIVVILVAYLKWRLNYWQRKGVKVPSNTSLIFGNHKEIFLGRANFGEVSRDFYNRFRAVNQTHGGVYLGPVAIWIPVDVDLIKTILQKDFVHFMNHGGYLNEENDPLAAHLFALEDQKWRNMRVKLTPTFTSGKMKMMFQIISNCSKGIKDVLVSEGPKAVDIKEVVARFTTDVIGSCAFGLECNSLKDPNADFRKYGRRFIENTFWENLKQTLEALVPEKFLDIIKYKLTKPDVEKFFMKAITDTVHYREKNNIYRKDFLHLLLQLKNRGKVSDDEKIINEDGTVEQGLTMNELAAQSFVFFIAGFETSSTLMTFAFYELASNPDIQDKLRQEILSILAKNNGEISYDAIMEMNYLDKVINETLRKYPPIPVLPRRCTKDYIVPGTSITIEKGTDTFISVWALQMDPEFYPNPEKFDPERFSEEEKLKRPAFSWLPFGEGPRVCIGLRFGLMQAKVGLVSIIQNFKVSVNSKTKVPLVWEKTAFITTAEGGIWLDVVPLN